LKHPVIVAVSKDDKTLATSQRIAGDIPRVGNVLIDHPRVHAAIEHYGIDVVDLSQVSGSDYFAHSKIVEALPELQSIAATGGAPGNRTIGGAGVFVLNGAGKILSAPAIIGDALLQQ
jgi:esterase/lipase superfamily enzyme